MEFIINYWYIIVGIIAVLIVAGFAIYKFAGLPTSGQIKKIKEWLLYAVTMAEKELGSGTGQIKLRSVYDLFVTRFPTMAKLISFETFSKWVDEALDSMEGLLETNPKVKALVENENENK